MSGYDNAALARAGYRAYETSDRAAIEALTFADGKLRRAEVYFGWDLTP